MKKTSLMPLFGAAILFGACLSDDNGEFIPVFNSADFTVTIENVVIPKPIFQSAVFNIPEGATDPAPIFPGDAYEFTINAGPVVVPNDGGTRLSFVSMFVQSNDLFFAPAEEGIALYDAMGNPIGANGPEDVTDQVLLWDAGTEVNEETGGPNQKPQQDPDAEDQGVDENGVVTLVENNMDAFGNVIPDNNAVIKVSIENTGPAQFTVRIENVSTASTIPTPGQGAGTTAAVPLSPGVYVVHTLESPFFEEGSALANAGLVQSAEGVENIAEDGFTEALAVDTQESTGLIIPLSPGVWAVHSMGVHPIYSSGNNDFGEGLEAVAEDGDPSMLLASLQGKTGVVSTQVFNIPTGATDPGPIGPGGSYAFSFTAIEGDYLSFATMFVQSNDWFYAFSENGIPLFENRQPISGDITSQVFLYDAGTEIDEYPGAGLSQVIRQSASNTGSNDPDATVRLVDPTSQPNVPESAGVIKVSITATPRQ
ncbi:spondin domain-containing protein [Arenibacter lacus]|uniref:spondin domain-containing protein n=1 Tax=Arenibacter lacus TaxID=2608629 RepID=UPI001CC45E37|nr:spondin domain-containing protein [Arenibacter lacus]